MDTRNWCPSKELKSTISYLLKKNAGNSFNYYYSTVELSWTLFHKKKVKECRPNAQTPEMLFEEK